MTKKVAEDSVQKHEPARAPDGKWLKGQTGNPEGSRHRGGTAEFARYREKMLKDAAPELLEKLVSDAKNGEAWAMRLCIERLFPVAKATLPLVDLGVSEDAGAVETAEAVSKRVAAGELSADHGEAFVGLLESVKRLKSLEDIERRLEALEQLSGND